MRDVRTELFASDRAAAVCWTRACHACLTPDEDVRALREAGVNWNSMAPTLRLSRIGLSKNPWMWKLCATPPMVMVKRSPSP